MARRSKTDDVMLRDLSKALEAWCDANGIEWKKCSKYQWNVKVPEVDVLLSVYPGSGLVWVPYAHYTGTGAIDKSSTKHHFGDEKTMVAQLTKIIFAADAV